VSEFTLVALFAEAALVMLADQMANSGALVGRRVVSVGTGGTKRTVAVLVGRACRAVVLVREAKGRESGLEVWEEGQVRARGAGGIENAVRDGCGHEGLVGGFVEGWTVMNRRRVAEESKIGRWLLLMIVFFH
jgi:hypothetical protein